MNDTFLHEDGEAAEAEKLVRARTRANPNAFKSEDYEIDDRFRPCENVDDAYALRTVPDLVAHLEANKKSQLQASVLHYSPVHRSILNRRMSRERFLGAYEANRGKQFRLRESFGDSFATDGDGTLVGNGGSLLGVDPIPLLGGPFNKQLYYYDYLRMHGLSFYAFHHDPFARRIVMMMRDFTLGRGFRVDSEDKDALAKWRIFEEVNDISALMDTIALELSTYGEVMLWELPGLQTKIAYKVRPGQEPPVGLIPRIRLIDPSVIWEIVTYPEDITRVLYYQWVAPTQYQIYTGKDAGQPVPGIKFIFQQIPADQVMHHKINCMSGEKRGRSDLFPILGDLKRLRDAVDYEIIGAQKKAAWAIDTEIQGSQVDINNYCDDPANKNFPMAGSEFVHSSKIKRSYQANDSAGSGQSTAFEWALGKIAAGSGIPQTYFGTGVGGSHSTRAGALVGTEPVAKMFEMRQLQMERIIKRMWKRFVQERWGHADAECEVTFPEVITQDRSAKLKDLVLCESQGYINNEVAATIAGKEMQISEYEYSKHSQAAAAPAGKPQPGGPLSSPAALPSKKLPSPAAPGQQTDGATEPSSSAVTQDQRRAVKYDAAH